MKKSILLLFPFLSLLSTAQIPYPIVGTGVTLCYNNSSQITCPVNTTDPFYGQAQGIYPSYTNNGNGTITDQLTGLTWIQARGTKVSWDSAFILASQCTTGGFTDWRVPTIKELYSLIDYKGKQGTTHPTCIAYLDTNYFGWTTGDLNLGERIIDAQDWSATRYKGLTMAGDTTVFGVNFVDGRIKGYPQYQPPTNTTPNRMYVRFVRGNTSYGINNFADNGDSTVSDHATGLMWMKNDSKSGMNWQSALSWAQQKNTQNYLGYNDWRLPTAKELQSIVDYTRCKDLTGTASIDPIFNISQITDEGGNPNWPFFWTNTTHLDNMYGVYVTFGEALGYMKIPPTATYYTLVDVHGAGAQRSDPKSGNVTNYYLGTDQGGNPVYGLGPQGDVIRINNYVRLVRTETSSVGGIHDDVENEILTSNYPNPFSSEITINVQLTDQSDLNMEIRNTLGALVNEYYFSLLDPGANTITWNGKDRYGRELPSGVYYIKLISGSKNSVIKLIKL